MTDGNDNLTRVLAIAEAHTATVDLAANIPFGRLQSGNYCTYRYRDLGEARFGDLAWCDLLFVVRGASPRMLAAVKQAKRMGRRVIAYWDDNPFEIPSYSLSYRHFNQPQVQKSVRQILNSADLISAATDPLADHLGAQTAKPVHRLPVAATGLVEAPNRHRRPRREVRIGFAGSLDHKLILERLVVPALSRLAGRSRRFAFEVVGPRPEVPPELAGCFVYRDHIDTYADWVEFRNNSGWDIALAPLQESSFSACKFHNKFLETASGGIAGVFSKVLPYTAVITHGQTGLLADNTPEAWADAIETLMDRPDLRRRIAVNAWEKVRRENSLDVVADSYRSQLGDMLSYRAAPNPRWLRVLPWRAVNPIFSLWDRLRVYGMLRAIGKVLAASRR